MNKIYFVLVSLIMGFLQPAGAQCTLSLDSLSIDSSISDCNHLFFKFSHSGGTITSYKWTYGDGNSCTCFKPKNVYNTNGTFQVCGIIKDMNGCADTLCISVKVNCDPCELSEIGIHSFDSLSYSCDEYEFNTITSTNAKKIKWNFGDGDSSGSKFIVHKYKQNGTYQVKLTIQDSIGCADTAEMTVKVDCPVKPPCTFRVTKIDTATGADCKTKNFSLQTNGKPVTVLWKYGDGQQTLTNGKISSRTYADTGLYKLCVLAIDSSDCRDSLCQWVKVACPKKNVSLEELDKNGFIIYPNPVEGMLYLETELESDYVIYDLTLKKVSEGQLAVGINGINLELLESGTYMLRMENEGAVLYYKIVRQ
jgi:hypothetical protein